MGSGLRGGWIRGKSFEPRRAQSKEIEPQRHPDEILDREERSREPDRLISWGRQRARRKED